jgi:copper(I)-binding protein
MLAVAAVALLAACGQPQEAVQSGAVGANAEVGRVLLRNVHVDGPPTTGHPDRSAATVWLTLVNEAAQPDALTDVSTDVATRVVILAGTGCDATAETLPRLDLPAGTPAPGRGGYHLRLVELRVGILPGANIPITFTFRHAGSITVPTPVDSGAGPAGVSTPCPSPSSG